MMGGDLDDVETKIGDFFDVSQAVGAPLLLPVRVIDAEFHSRASRLAKGLWWLEITQPVARSNKPPPTPSALLAASASTSHETAQKLAWSYFLTLSNSARSVGVEDRKTMTAIRNR